jgi:sulfonate transport system substrate-binding protein
MRWILGVYLIVSFGFAKPLVIAFQDRVVDAIVIVAVEKKFFEEEGVEIAPKRFTSGPATSEALIFGDADIATMGDTAALIAVSKYCPNVLMLTSLGGGEKRHGVVVANDSNASSLSSLIGKKIAVKKGTSTHGGVMLKAKAEGINLDKEMIDLEPSLMASALMEKEVDAVIASEPTPSVLIEKGIGKRIMTLDGVGNTYPLLLMVKEASFKGNVSQMKGVFKALEKSAQFINEHPEQSAQIVSNVSKLSIAATKEAMSYHFYKIGWDDATKESLSKMAGFLYDNQKIKALPDMEKCIAH